MASKQLQVQNTYTRTKEEFKPLQEGYVGMYVCGPTVYSNVHFGNCRTFVSFDVIYRYLLYLGYKVRYVRNITDAGHLSDEGEDRISKRSQLEKLEPMEIVQKYTVDFHEVMKQFNALPPTIEPTATGHIVEQMEMAERILSNGYGYEKNGTVYFDVAKLIAERPEYGQLSGKKVDDLLSESRDNLKNQDEKRHPSDFALWIKGDELTLQKWRTPWSVGFPGWHLECSAMSQKYLGERFDIHGGGMDLQFPHHENEIAQSIGACGCTPANYWLHTNMLTINGEKMSKSKGNEVLPHELFTGNYSNGALTRAYSPMTVRFFMLQSHYRSPLDFSDDALQAAEKGYKRLMEAVKLLDSLEAPASEYVSDEDNTMLRLLDEVEQEMNDDFHTPLALAKLFEIVTKIYSFKNGQLDISTINMFTLERMKTVVRAFVFEVFGLLDEAVGADNDTLDGVIQLVIDLRKAARANKDWATGDQIRDRLKALGLQLKDGKEGTTWGKE